MNERSLVFCMALLASLISYSQAGGDSKEWIILFDGKNLNSWEDKNGKPIKKGWVVEDGVISLKEPKAVGDIYTKETFEDFELEFEWKISAAGNSGVKYRVKRIGKKILGIEYQVLDDERHIDRELASHRSASFYDLKAAPDDKPLKPVGDWNSARIVVKGAKLEHYLNGKLVVAMDQSSEEWKKAFAASKYKKHEGFGLGSGKIMLQDHKDPVWFRNIRVRRL